MKIKKFKKTKDDIYELLLENNEKLILYEDIILKNDLLIKKEIDESIISKLKKENDYSSVYNLCIKYISFKMRCKNEIKKYLLRKNISNEIIENVVSKLEKEGYINDKKYAEFYVKDKFKLSSSGPLKIKKELTSFGIKEEIIDYSINNIEKINWEEKLQKLISKKLSLTKGSKKEKENKIISYFYNLGYDCTMIQDIMQDLDVKSDIHKLKKEYDLLIKKYSRKYNGNELNYIILNKLMMKGYTKKDIEQINN